MALNRTFGGKERSSVFEKLERSNKMEELMNTFKTLSCHKHSRQGRNNCWGIFCWVTVQDS